MFQHGARLGVEAVLPGAGRATGLAGKGAIMSAVSLCVTRCVLSTVEDVCRADLGFAASQKF